MPPWLALTAAEARRVRGLAGLARRQPLVAAVAAAALIALLWASWRGGGTAGRALADAPAALLTVNAIVLWLCALLGGTSSLVAPRLDRWDEQLRLMPLRRTTAFAGATAVPLLVGWIAMTIPLIAFVVPMFRALPAVRWPLGVAVYEVVCLAACAAGAALGEAARWLWFQRTWRGAVAPAVGACCAAVLAVGPAVGARQPWWALLAVLLPRGSGDGFAFVPPAVVSALLATAVAAAAFGTWIVVGSVPTHPRHSGIGRWRLPAAWHGRAALLAWWALASFVREQRMWLTAAFTLACAAFFIAADPLIGNGTHAFAQFAPLTAMMGGAQVALMLSERVQASTWFWRLTPARRRTPGLWWWVGGSALAAAISLPSLAIPAVAGQLRSPMGAVVLASSCFAAAVIGRLSPWESRSQGQQTVAMALYFAVLFAVGAAFDWLTHHAAVPFGLTAVVVSCALLSAVACARLPWKTSWRAT